MRTLLLIVILLSSTVTMAKDIRTNSLTIKSAPDWLTRVRVAKVRDRIQSKLEWTIRRIEVQWHSSQKDFEKVHSLGSGPSAVTIKRNNFQKIHMGPSINDSQFDQIFAHELVHVIFAQKYKGAIPRWLEEGFANHLSQRKKVDYKWLSQQKFPTNITDLEHPFKNSPVSPKFHYRASQGLVEMLDKKCDLENLLRLSVERKMANYIQTYCEIKDINQAFKKWVDEKAKAS